MRPSDSQLMWVVNVTSNVILVDVTSNYLLLGVGLPQYITSQHYNSSVVQVQIESLDRLYAKEETFPSKMVVKSV